MSSSEMLIPATLRWHALPAQAEVTSSPLPSKVMVPDYPVPCRRCLTDTKPGERAVLFSYDPFLGDSAYRCRSPIFMHTEPECQLAVDVGVLPKSQSERLLSVRGYDEQNCLVDAEVVEGKNVLEILENRFFANGEVEYVHLHYARHGCFAVRVDRR